MRILLVAYHYPPDPVVGSLRPAKVAAALRAAGHQVKVLSVARPDLPASNGDVERIRENRSPRAWYALMLRRLRGNAPVDPATKVAQPENNAGYAPPTSIPAWKRHLLSFLWLPDDRQGFVPRAYRAARSAVHEGIDVIYTTAPPFSAHLVGWLVRKRTGTPWIAEFRDPWVDGPRKPAFVRSVGSDRIEAWLERQCLRTADRVVAVSEGTARLLDPKLHGRNGGGASVVVRNGIDRLTEQVASAQEGPVRIAYFGNLYLGRDPRPFLEGLARLRTTRPLGPDRLRVDFFGACVWYRDISVRDEIRKRGLDDIVHLNDPVPHDVCARIMEGTDILLLLAQRQPAQVPNKLYEYLGLRKPILAFVDEGGETAGMLEQVGGHALVVNEDADASARAIAALLDGEPGLVGREDVLRLWSTESQLRRLVQLVEETG